MGSNFKNCVDIFKQLQAALESVEYPHYLFKPKQILCFEHLLAGRDVIGVLPTGFGKSVLFQLLSDFLPKKCPEHENNVIVVMPLNSIIDDQLQILKQRGISASVLKTRGSEFEIPSLFPTSETEKVHCIPSNIKNGDVKIILCHPEDLLSPEGRSLLKSTFTRKELQLV